jgi:receptor protein-tyrosine kinase
MTDNKDNISNGREKVDEPVDDSQNSAFSDTEADSNRGLLIKNAGELVLTLDSHGTLTDLPLSAKYIGEILQEQGKLSNNDIARILKIQENENDTLFGEIAVALNYISKKELNHALSIQFGYTVLPVEKKITDVDLVTITDPTGKRAEEFRALRSQLILNWFDQGQNSLAVISTGKGERRSNTIANLAVAFSQLGKQTLLIDANLRTPRQHRIFSLPRSSGLSTLLSGRRNECLPYQISTLPALSVLPSGPIPPNPQELLSQPAFKILLAIASDKYEIILVDTPPTHSCTDAEIIASTVEGVLIVLRKNITKMKYLSEIIGRLENSNATIAGCVLHSH